MEPLHGFRLSPQQRRLWLQPGGRRAVAQCAVLVAGAPLDLRAAADAAAARHEILRTTFRSPHGIKVPYQVVQAHLAPAWKELSLAAVPVREQEDRIRQLLAEERSQEPDLENGPVL